MNTSYYPFQLNSARGEFCGPFEPIGANSALQLSKSLQRLARWGRKLSPFAKLFRNEVQPKHCHPDST